MTTATIEEITQEEEQATAIRVAARTNAPFMAGVRQALQAVSEGDEGRLWEDVKKELGIV